MHISKIELEDIKSHENSKFEFERGTTAIMGENGAGKTTIIEAIAWALFGLIDYKKSDFVRRGAKKGVVRVTFVSGLDERKYLVHRDTKTGYYVYDPKLKTRIADKKEEVTRFLWQHLGVETGTDLEALFRRAIGVPQGTFTAIFLESPTERKKAFDKLLKVEEYRQSSDKLRETAKYIELKMSGAREKIARAEGELTPFDQLKKELKTVRKRFQESEKSIRQLEKNAAAKKKMVDEFAKIEAAVAGLRKSFETLQNEKSRAEVVLSRKSEEKQAAEKAANKIEDVRPAYEKHLEALGVLKKLESKRAEREKLNSELGKIEAALATVRSEQKSTAEDLKQIQRDREEIESLRPRARDQETVEKRREALRNLITNAKTATNQLDKIDRKLKKLRDRYRKNQERKKEAEQMSSEAGLLGERQKRDDELRNRLADLNATLERDRKFQSEIENGLCPILSEKCLNLKDGQTLDDFVNSQFSEVTSQLKAFESERKELALSLAASREAEKFVAKLDTLKKREEEIATEGVALNEEKQSLQETADNREGHQNELKEVERTLEALENPKARIRMLEKEVKKETSLQEQATQIESKLNQLENDRRVTIEKLEVYKDLDSDFREFSTKRDETVEAHREYLANEAAAKSLPDREKELTNAQKEFSTIEGKLKTAQAEFEKEASGFDAAKYADEQRQLSELEKELIEANLTGKHLGERKESAELEIARLKELRKSLKAELKEKEKLKKVSDVTAFIRTTLKEAAPRVARNYVYHVSSEANQLFRDITGNAQRTLKWADDYGIVLEEDGYDRPYQSLSGGEQMAAALAVRLALLKQLSDLRVAFFDEPTMNMDIERREGLAEQISQITENQTFDQLFVISHDDTFEGYVDNVINL